MGEIHSFLHNKWKKVCKAKVLMAKALKVKVY